MSRPTRLVLVTAPSAEPTPGRPIPESCLQEQVPETKRAGSVRKLVSRNKFPEWFSAAPRRITLRRGLLTLTVLSVAGVALAMLLADNPQQLRHLALPTLSAEPSLPLPSAHPLLEHLGTEVQLLGKVGKRVSGIAAGPDGSLWLGLFDGGVAVLRPGETRAQELSGLTGRERFVSAIAVHQGRVFAASYAGIAEYSLQGKKVALHLEGLAADGLAVSGPDLWVATGKGAYRWTPSGFEPLPDTEVEGAPLRLTALSAAAGQVWLGTSRGLYLSGGEGSAPRWLPLVFGSPGATTNVVTAVAAFPSGAVVGTDDGGLAWVWPDGGVRAARFEQARANEINPGAAAVLGQCALFGTQGAGLLLASAQPGMAVARLGPAVQVSAVAVVGKRVVLGTSDGELLSLQVPEGQCAPSPGRVDPA